MSEVNRRTCLRWPLLSTTKQDEARLVRPSDILIVIVRSEYAARRIVTLGGCLKVECEFVGYLEYMNGSFFGYDSE